MCRGEKQQESIIFPCCYQALGFRARGCPALPLLPGRIPGLRFLGWFLGFFASLHGRSWNSSENLCRACRDDLPKSVLPVSPAFPSLSHPRERIAHLHPTAGKGSSEGGGITDEPSQPQCTISWWYLELLLEGTVVA